MIHRAFQKLPSVVQAGGPISTLWITFPLFPVGEGERISLSPTSPAVYRDRQISLHGSTTPSVTLPDHTHCRWRRGCDTAQNCEDSAPAQRPSTEKQHSHSFRKRGACSLRTHSRALLFWTCGCIQCTSPKVRKYCVGAELW